MFGLPKNPSVELWDGPRTGLDGIIEKFGADEVCMWLLYLAFFRQITTNTLDFLGIQLHAIPKSLKGSRQ
jgi:hypothetical protein